MPEKKNGGMRTSQLPYVNLPLWTEVVGVFNGLSFSDDSGICIKIGDKLLCLPKESIESEAALDKLHQGLIGHNIGLLRTDEPMKPLVVRLIDR